MIYLLVHKLEKDSNVLNTCMLWLNKRSDILFKHRKHNQVADTMAKACRVMEDECVVSN